MCVLSAVPCVCPMGNKTVVFTLRLNCSVHVYLYMYMYMYNYVACITFSAALLPFSICVSTGGEGGNFVSCGEDSSVRVWRGQLPVQAHVNS